MLMNKVINKHQRSGFTLVELIIIIAVIGILTTIGLVSYNGYRQRAAKTAADSTVQQVKLKLGEYFTDNNRYPVNTAAVDTYLRQVKATTTADDFKKMTDAGATYAPLADDNSSCQSGATPPPCAKYTITVPASYWNGTDAPISVSQ